MLVNIKLPAFAYLTFAILHHINIIKLQYNTIIDNEIIAVDLYDDELARRTMREALRKVNRAVKRTELRWLKKVSSSRHCTVQY